MLALGAALGFLGGLFGIGGGIIVIPLLVLGFGLDQTVAQGTALVLTEEFLGYLAFFALTGWAQKNKASVLALSLRKPAFVVDGLTCSIFVRLGPLELLGPFAG
jgi:uncharacterized membrane protein YfcA